MSVILTGMGMPSSCNDCPVCHINWDNYAYCALGKSETSGNERPADCPLKSVDGLIVEIEKEKNREIGGNAASFVSGYKCAFGETIETIKTYCGMGETANENGTLQ